MRGIPRILAVALVLAGILSTRAYGQGGATGAISGVVVDTSGGSVAEAEVQIIDTRTESLARSWMPLPAIVTRPPTSAHRCSEILDATSTADRTSRTGIFHSSRTSI